MRWQIQGWMTHGRCLLRLGGPREGFKTLLRSLSTEPESLGFPSAGGSGVELVDKNLEPMQSASVRPHSSNSDSEVWDPQVRLLLRESVALEYQKPRFCRLAALFPRSTPECWIPLNVGSPLPRPVPVL